MTVLERAVTWLAPLLRDLDDAFETLCGCDGDLVCEWCEPGPDVPGSRSAGPG